MTHEHDPISPTELAARAPRDAERTPNGEAAPHVPVADDVNSTEENADRPEPAGDADETA